jgi:predicted porin
MKPTIIAVACTLLFAGSSAFAADSSEVELLKQQLQVMQQQMASMQNKIDAISASPVATAAPAATATPGQSPLSVNIGGASVTLYGHADLSVEQTSNGKENVSQVSSNLSYLGVRASSKELGTSGLKAIAQFETLVNVSGTPTEVGGLGSRNSFLGVEGKFGKLMLGKTDTPYKRSTGSMDPFSASVGDYNSILGNTGGDLRAEFDARLPHSIFYDSPKMNGFSVNALFSPGQKYDNLANSDKYAYAQGEKVCAGATPGSSGSTAGGQLDPAAPNSCNDGAFKNAGSLALNYANGPLFATVSYERHDAVDRTGDTGGVISNESAAKVGVTYNFGKNRLSAIYEKFYRAGGIDPTVNERARDGYYISDVQQLGNGLDLMASWAHAGQTPGSPDFLTADDHANMYALGLKYHYDKQTSVYVVGAVLNQGAGAHYTLGSGGHGVPIAAPRDANGDTIGGQSIKALSVGMQYSF